MDEIFCCILSDKSSKLLANLFYMFISTNYPGLCRCPSLTLSQSCIWLVNQIVKKSKFPLIGPCQFNVGKQGLNSFVSSTQDKPSTLQSQSYSCLSVIKSGFLSWSSIKDKNWLIYVIYSNWCQDQDQGSDMLLCTERIYCLLWSPICHKDTANSLFLCLPSPSQDLIL